MTDTRRVINTEDDRLWKRLNSQPFSFCPGVKPGAVGPKMSAWRRRVCRLPSSPAHTKTSVCMQPCSLTSLRSSFPYQRRRGDETHDLTKRRVFFNVSSCMNFQKWMVELKLELVRYAVNINDSFGVFLSNRVAIFS